MLWSLFFVLTSEFTPKNSLMHYYCHVKLCIFHRNFLKFKFDTTKKNLLPNLNEDIDIRSLKCFPSFWRQTIKSYIWDKSSEGNAHKHNNAKLDISLTNRLSLETEFIRKANWHLSSVTALCNVKMDNQ